MNNRIDLAKYFNEIGFSVGAEIGVADGRFSDTLCKNITNLKLYCIDPWEPYKGNRRGGGQEQQYTNYDLARARLLSYDVEFLRGKSTEMAPQIPDGSLDFVFIDGNHDYDYVMEDIITWNRKVRTGGIVSGHDYYNFRNSGVIEAVNDYARFHKIDVRVVGEMRKRIRDDDQACWWWVK